jgi:hypothetical protein
MRASPGCGAEDFVEQIRFDRRACATGSQVEHMQRAAFWGTHVNRRFIRVTATPLSKGC